MRKIFEKLKKLKTVRMYVKHEQKSSNKQENLTSHTSNNMIDGN